VKVIQVLIAHHSQPPPLPLPFFCRPLKIILPNMGIGVGPKEGRKPPSEEARGRREARTASLQSCLLSSLLLCCSLSP